MWDGVEGVVTAFFVISFVFRIISAIRSIFCISFLGSYDSSVLLVFFARSFSFSHLQQFLIYIFVNFFWHGFPFSGHLSCAILLSFVLNFSSSALQKSY